MAVITDYPLMPITDKKTLEHFALNVIWKPPIRNKMMACTIFLINLPYCLIGDDPHCGEQVVKQFFATIFADSGNDIDWAVASFCNNKLVLPAYPLHFKRHLAVLERNHLVPEKTSNLIWFCAMEYGIEYRLEAFTHHSLLAMQFIKSPLFPLKHNIWCYNRTILLKYGFVHSFKIKHAVPTFISVLKHLHERTFLLLPERPLQLLPESIWVASTLVVVAFTA